MDDEQALARFGLQPGPSDLAEIRDLLRDEISRERGGRGDTELLKLLCVQLFNAGLVEDSLLIWSAKSASLDAGCSIDVQLLCGAGLTETKAFLAGRTGDAAAEALQRIEECQASGDFDGFSPRTLTEVYADYYGEAPVVTEVCGFRLSASGDDLAYLATPLSTKQERVRVVRHIEVTTGIEGYRGPDVWVDLDDQGRLLGIEIME